MPPKEPQQEAPARAQDRVSETAEPIAPISEKVVTESIGGIAALNQKAEPTKGFNIEDPTTWGSPFNTLNSDYTRQMGGSLKTAFQQQFAATGEGTVGTQVGQIDEKPANQ